MKNNILISFIIPLFNSEKWILSCLESIFKLPIEPLEYEIIVIDDGSVDSSPVLVEQCQSEHENLSLLRQENKGTSSARNLGLDKACGEWIWFVDADDSIAPITFENWKLLRQEMSNDETEMIVFNYRKKYVDYDVDVQKIRKKHIVDGCEYLSTGSLYVWNRLFRLKKIRNIRFLEGTKNLEDFYFDICAILPMRRIVCLPVACYIYNQQNSTSTSRNVSKVNLQKLNDDTQTVFLHLIEYRKNLKHREFKVISNLLNYSVTGYLFSLFTRYDNEHLHSGIGFLRKYNLYPARYFGNLKADFFLLLANHERIFSCAQKIIKR